MTSLSGMRSSGLALRSCATGRRRQLLYVCETPGTTHCPDEVCRFFREEGWDPQVNVDDALVRRCSPEYQLSAIAHPPARLTLRPFLFKRRGPIEELEAQDAERPQVDIVPVRVLQDHLWREVVERAAVGVATGTRESLRQQEPFVARSEGDLPAARRMHTPPEVGNLELPVEAWAGSVSPRAFGLHCAAPTQQQVLRLDVAVDHMLLVQVGQRVGHLCAVLVAALGIISTLLLPLHSGPPNKPDCSCAR